MELLRGRPVHEYRMGLPVDASGETATGDSFSGIRDYKRLLMKEKRGIARSFLSQLSVYATGAEMQFADREVLDGILNETEAGGYGVRSLIHALVQSRLFRNQ